MPPIDSAEVDQNLFPDAQSLKDAEALWGEGIEEGEKKNPTGNFTCEIDSASFGRSQSSNSLQFHYHLKILGGANDQVEIDKYDGMSSPKQTSITQSQLRVLGIDYKKVSVKELPAHLLALKGKKVLVNAKQNGDFYNIRFVRMANDNMTGSAGPSRTSAPKGAKPSGRGGKF